MRILITGNSQVACLKTAFRKDPKVLTELGDIHFYCFPGGTGPSFAIEDGRLSLNGVRTHPDHPPFADSPETPDRPLSEYDAILVSALGRIGGGFGTPSDMLLRGVLHEYQPKDENLGAGLLSKSCYRRIIEAELSAQPGIGFVKRLRQAFDGVILVQRFPRVTAEAASRPDWILHQIYQDAVGAHRFFSEARDGFLEAWCAECGAELLPYPRSAERPDHLTPAEWMPHPDGLHPGPEFGGLVLAQVASRLK